MVYFHKKIFILIKLYIAVYITNHRVQFVRFFVYVHTLQF